MGLRDDAYLVATALRWEAAAVRRGAAGGAVVSAGVRARRPRRLRDALRRRPGVPLVVAGVAGARTDTARPGDLIVASTVRSARSSIPIPAASLLADLLRARGARVHVGDVLETDRPVWNTGAPTGCPAAIAVDLESARLLELADTRPCAVVRAVVDTPARPLCGPATVPGGLTALLALRHVGPVARDWARALAGEHMSASNTVHNSTVEEVRHR